jgi:hypothetical protein
LEIPSSYFCAISSSLSNISDTETTVLFLSFDDDTSKEIQKILVKQQVAKTAQDIFMGIRFVGIQQPKNS